MGEESEHWRMDEIGLCFSQNWRRIREEREGYVDAICISSCVCILCNGLVRKRNILSKTSKTLEFNTH